LYRTPTLLAAHAAAVLLLACNGDTDDEPIDSDTDIGGAPTDFTIRFRAAFGAEPATCDRAYDGVGTTNARVRLVDFRAYVSDVVLLADGGVEQPLSMAADGTYNDGTAALLDFATDQGECQGIAGRNATIVGQAPDLAYTGLRFTLGLPRDITTTPLDTALPPLDVTDLFQNSTVGRQHSRVAVKAEGATDTFESYIHGVRCQAGGDCEDEALVTVTLSGFDPTSSEVLFDLEALLSRNDVTANGCPSLPADDDCRTYFVSYGLGANGPDWITAD